MKNNTLSQFVLNRRTLGILSFGAALSACGGGGSDDVGNDDNKDTEVFRAEVINSGLPYKILSNDGEYVFLQHIAVGASGSIYTHTYNSSEIEQRKPDGTLIRSFPFPIEKSKSPFQIGVVEDPKTNDIFISGAYVNLGSRGSRVDGGFIARFTQQSSQILFKSDTVAPAGLARDKEGNLYFMDMKKGDVLCLNPSKNEVKVIYRVAYDKKFDEADTDFGGIYIQCKVAVADNGVVYAYLKSQGHRSSETYQKGVLRLRNSRVDSISDLNTCDFGAYGNSLFFLSSAEGEISPRISRVDAAGVISTVTEKLNTLGSTQFGSPGALSQHTSWIDMSPDGRIHLRSENEGEDPHFYTVRLQSQG